ncbi:MAG: FtsW/RodA/SpoVE family cell cycle protein [Micrococcales bacterium]|nr:FtsW/RodA/SpoVE family cell cycle protein [Micrococcales bacterium]
MATLAPSPARPGRGRELALLLLALAISTYAYAQVGLAMEGRLPADFVRYSVGFAGLALVLHILLRVRAPYADPVILPTVVLLNGTGLAMIYRLQLRYQVSLPMFGSIASRQLLWTGVGIGAAALVIVLLRDHRTLRRFTFTAMLIGLAALVLPLAPGIGKAEGGSRIWIRLGSFSFQPAELSKILLAVFFAGYLVTRRDTLSLAGPKILRLQLPRLRDLGPILLAWLTSLGVLIFEKDLGTSLLFFGLFVAMLYVATDRPSWIALGLILFAVGVTAAHTAFSHVRSRFDIWLHPFSSEVYNRDPGGSGQLVKGLFGMANGGLFGTGWGRGRPDLTELAFSDFIVTSLGEELGLTGLFAILLCFAILIQRGMRTAVGVSDGFGKLLASGLAFSFALQVFTVVGGVTRLIPLTGLTVPFMAAGGSALVANWMIAALLLRISDGARRPAPATNEIDLAPILAAEAADAADAAKASAGDAP